MKHLLPLLALLFALPALAQNTVVITGSITNAQTHLPVHSASVFLEKSSRGDISNRNGKFSITVPGDKAVRLQFSHVSYTTQHKSFTPAELSADTIRLNVELVPETYVLKPFSFSDVQRPDTVFGTAAFSVADYEFHRDQLLLLGFDKGLHKDARLVLTDRSETILDEMRLGDEVEELYLDFQGNINVLCQNSVYRVVLFRNTINVFSLPVYDFYTMLYPGIDTLYSQILYSDYRSNFPEFSYFAYHTIDSTNAKVATIKNEPLMREYRFEYYHMQPREKLEARKIALRTGNSKHEIAAEMTGFTKSWYFTPLYAPLFVIDDTLMVFDHYNNFLYHFDGHRHKLDSVPISYHEKTGSYKWERLLLRDRENDRIWSLYTRQGRYYLRCVSRATGKIETEFMLTHRHVEKIKIKNDYVYYVYRKHGEVAQKFLYRELIRSSASLPQEEK